MFRNQPILIVEPDTYRALDLSWEIEQSDGSVVGPADDARVARDIIDTTEVAAAIIDFEVDGASAVVILLAERSVPIVVQTATSLPDVIARLDGRIAVLSKPVDPHTVIEMLIVQIGKADVE